MQVTQLQLAADSAPIGWFELVETQGHVSHSGMGYPWWTRKGAGDLHVELRECLRSYEELLPGRSLDVAVERIGPEHAGE